MRLVKKSREDRQPIIKVNPLPLMTTGVCTE